jgi:holin-like protein
MLNAITLLLVCQLIGELAVAASGLPVPGPVVGMALLFTGLVVRGGIPDELARTADGILGNLSLMFVPAGVGVMLHAALLGRDWLAIGVALVASTLVTIAVTALMMVWLQRWTRRSEGAGE